MSLEVSEEQFYAVMGQLDVHPTPVDPYPYTSIFKHQRSGIEYGRIVETDRPDAWTPVRQYFLCEIAGQPPAKRSRETLFD